MNRGENLAVEAMLGLARPSCPFQPSYPAYISGPTPTAPLTSSTPPRQPCPLDFNCGSSVSPSLSPVQDRREPSIPPQTTRPNAMRLSQLLTDDSPPETSSFRSTEASIAGESLQQPQLPYSLQLPHPTSTPRPPPITVTEPVTPPFSPFTPPVLPPLSAVAHIGMPATGINNAENAAPSPSTWMPASLPTMKISGVLASRDSNMQAAAPLQSQGFHIGAVHSHSTTETVKKIVKRPYKKYYSNPTPSAHCHVCARTSKAVKFAICARIQEGLCRKVICYKCFIKFGWDWQSAVNSKTWVCVHCRGVCPEGRSQCYIYSRVNSKRESKRGKKAQMLLAKMQDGIAGNMSENNANGGGLVPNMMPSVLPSIATMGGEGITSFSKVHSLKNFIRPV